jgi:hypothetical protein
LYLGHGKTGHASLDHLNPVGYLIKRDRDGNLIGKANHIPILDTRLYTVKFPDGKEAEYAANIIAVTRNVINTYS